MHSNLCCARHGKDLRCNAQVAGHPVLCKARKERGKAWEEVCYCLPSGVAKRSVKKRQWGPVVRFLVRLATHAALKESSFTPISEALTFLYEPESTGFRRLAKR